MTKISASSFLNPTDTFVHRHNAPDEQERAEMLETIGASNLDSLISESVPQTIRAAESLKIPVFGENRTWGEKELLDRFHQMAQKNEVNRSLIGMGYYDCIVPPVILRNILENPGWYTQYTPYQAEISQGRLEALLNFQTMISELTGMSLANASLLDEATAAAEALNMCFALTRKKKKCFFLSDQCHPQTIAVIKTRAETLGIDARVVDLQEKLQGGKASFEECCGVLLQYPTSDGRLLEYGELADVVHEAGAMLVAATDLLALALYKAPGDFGADICVGSSQRFGVPLGYGGPHAAFLSTREEFRKAVPGRIIGVSRDSRGKPAYRMAMQTREQHIRREKATSNICTAQVLLAIMAGMYGVYHGPEGIKAIAKRVHALTSVLAAGLKQMNFALADGVFFDTLRVNCSSAQERDGLLERALGEKVNLRKLGSDALGISLDEKSTVEEVDQLFRIFAEGRSDDVPSAEGLANRVDVSLSEGLARESDFMTHPVFHSYRSEHEMLRYIHRLQSKDLSLTTSMISLGSCTMKLNATSEMLPVSWPEFANMHPFAPVSQCQGYQELFQTLESWLAEITGFAAVSLQPNAGSQGEFAGLLAIHAFHKANGHTERDVCLIPVSAHGTNPASAVMAGMRVVPVACDDQGNIDVEDLKSKAEKHKDNLAALMVTYPSTHGVFETKIREICSVVHDFGGRVYLDGANMNAQVGLCRPGDYGADVCHLNLHKTFCIPHGGGGPGMGPIAVTKELAPHLPTHPLVETGGDGSVGPVAAAPWGSPSILPISWMYIALMGGPGLTQATQIAILNANYMATRLADHYPILFRGEQGRVAHEFILDLRPFKSSAGIEAEDVAKRLMDYGFHAPTMSFPVAGTLMIEPTESESKHELDRFCDAMIAIRAEIADVESGKSDRQDNPLKNAPHPAEEVVSGEWTHSYPREQAAFPLPWVREHKFWPAVSRVDNVWGDRNLICTCPPMSEYE